MSAGAWMMAFALLVVLGTLVLLMFALLRLLLARGRVRAVFFGLVVTLLLWDQELEVRRLQKRLGEDQPMPEVFSNNPILQDLTNWVPVEKV